MSILSSSGRMINMHMHRRCRRSGWTLMVTGAVLLPAELVVRSWLGAALSLLLVVLGLWLRREGTADENRRPPFCGRP